MRALQQRTLLALRLFREGWGVIEAAGKAQVCIWRLEAAIRRRLRPGGR